MPFSQLCYQHSAILVSSEPRPNSLPHLCDDCHHHCSSILGKLCRHWSEQILAIHFDQWITQVSWPCCDLKCAHLPRNFPWAPSQSFWVWRALFVSVFSECLNCVHACVWSPCWLCELKNIREESTVLCLKITGYETLTLKLTQTVYLFTYSDE